MDTQGSDWWLVLWCTANAAEWILVATPAAGWPVAPTEGAD
jgi:hypothetical protein